MLALIIAITFAATPDGGTPADAGASAVLPDGKIQRIAADGTPMFHQDGEPNTDYFVVPPTYRSPEGFQALRWGMSRKEVQKAVPKAKIAGPLAMGLEMTVTGKKAAVSFMLTPARLAAVGVYFTQRHTVAEAYLEEFEDLKRTLTKKYGEPSKDAVEWHNKTLFYENPDHLATAVQMGHASILTEWATGETTIRLACEGDQGRPVVNIIYASSRLLMEFMKAQDETESAEL